MEEVVDDINFDEIDEDLERFQQDEIVADALAKGVDLREYSRQIDDELKQVEMESVREYVGESDNVVYLHNQIQACDVVLARMQEMLLGFQADLGGISEEIRYLQDQSLSMNIKLRNRRAAQAKIEGFLENVELPQDLITTVVEVSGLSRCGSSGASAPLTSADAACHSCALLCG
jgi:hypothetical protein